MELWLAKGWLDYLVPQLYWPRAQAAQAFGPLLQYWQAQNPQGRHIWPGLYTSKVLAADKPDSWPVDEIVGQIALQRELAPQAGHAHFSMIALAQNRRGLADALKAGPYAGATLVPGHALAGGPATRLRCRRRPSSSAAAATAGCAWTSAAARPCNMPSGCAAASAGSSMPARSCGSRRAGLNAIVASALDRVGREGPRSAWKIA